MAVLLLGLAAHATPSFSPLKKHERSNLLLHHDAVSHDSLAGERFETDIFLSELKTGQVRRCRTKFRVPAQFTQLVVRETISNTSKPFIVFTESLLTTGEHFPPPFYYVFLFRLTLF